MGNGIYCKYKNENKTYLSIEVITKYTNGKIHYIDMAKYTNNKDSDWIYIIGSNAME